MVSPKNVHAKSREDAFAIIIPAYNEAATIRDVVIGACAFGRNVVVIDDGSTDETGKNLKDLDVTLLRNLENMGKAGSLWRGFQAVADRHAAVVTLDADGQHDPRDIPRLMAAWREEPRSIVIGTRQYRWHRYLHARRIANRIADFCLSWAAGYWIRDSQSGFRIYPSELLQRIDIAHDKAHGFVFESEVLIAAVRMGYSTSAVPINVAARRPGQQSHFDSILDTLRIARMIFNSLCEARFSLRNLFKILRGGLTRRPNSAKKLQQPPSDWP